MFKTKINKSKRAFSLYLNNEKLTSPKDQQQQQHPRKPTLVLSLLGLIKQALSRKTVKITTVVSRDYACMMSLNKDKTGRRLSWMLLLVMRRSLLFIIDLTFKLCLLWQK